MLNTTSEVFNRISELLFRGSTTQLEILRSVIDFLKKTTSNHTPID